MKNLIHNERLIITLATDYPQYFHLPNEQRSIVLEFLQKIFHNQYFDINSNGYSYDLSQYTSFKGIIDLNRVKERKFIFLNPRDHHNRWLTKIKKNYNRLLERQFCILTPNVPMVIPLILSLRMNDDTKNIGYTIKVKLNEATLKKYPSLKDIVILNDDVSLMNEFNSVTVISNKTIRIPNYIELFDFYLTYNGN